MPMPGVRESFAEVIDYRDLLYMLTWRDIKIRYKQSVMGFFWAILMPTIIVAAGLVVRFAFSMNSHQSLSLASIASVSLKSLPWAFFVSATKFATNSLVTNSNLVTKIYFPRQVFPLAAVLASLFDFAIVLLFLLVLFTAGLALFLACANLFFRDVKYIVDVLLTFGILFTPVFYEARMLGKYEPLVLINPLSAILEGMNDVVVRHQAPDYFWLTYVVVCSVSVFMLGWQIFSKAQVSFAENV
jgi:lipopolysaccharide transport system permease protein